MSTAPQIARIPRTIPSDRAWFDPYLLVVNTEIQSQDVFVPTGASGFLLATPNVRRMMLGFTQSQPTGDPVYSPWPDSSNFEFSAQGLVSGTQWFSLFDYGILVCAGWYASSAGNSTIRVTQILRKG